MKGRTVRIANVSLVLVLLGLCVACGGVRQAAARSKLTNDMKMIGLAYHNYLDRNPGKAPANAQDLLSVDPEAAPAIALIQSGQVVFLFNVKLTDMLDKGTSATVLAYEANAPTKGGLVLMADGSVKQMTAAEFQAAPKATPK